MTTGARTAKSSALSPMNWTIGMLMTGLLVAGHVALPWWAILIVGSCLATMVAGQVGLATYFAIKAPDNLRSEKFLLDKFKIERSLVGDVDHGLHPIDDDEVDAENAIDVGVGIVKAPKTVKP